MDQFDIYEDNIVLVAVLMLHESFLLLSREDHQCERSNTDYMLLLEVAAELYSSHVQSSDLILMNTLLELAIENRQE